MKHEWKRLLHFRVTVFWFSFLASCLSNASEDSVTEASTEEIITEKAHLTKLDHAVRLFDEFEEEYPELQFHSRKPSSFGKKGDKIKTYATYKKKLRYERYYYIIFEADGPEGKNKFHASYPHGNPYGRRRSSYRLRLCKQLSRKVDRTSSRAVGWSRYVS